MKKQYLLTLLCFIVSSFVFSQLDNTHYIPPMFGRENLGDHYIVLSTPSSTPFDVTITNGAGNLITTQTISNGASSSYYLGSGNGTELLVTEAELNTIMSGEGLILTAPEQFYVNIRVVATPQAGSLTSKGSKAAFGKDFRTGHMFNNTGDAFRKANFFSFMATENNTTVTVDDIRPGVIFRGTTPTGSPLTSPGFTITLDAGESYVVSAFVDETNAIENLNGVNGTHITSDKDIVVNTGTWLGGNAITGGTPAAGRDLGIDQIVSNETIGDEYVLIKGEGIDNEKVIVVADQDNTDIFLNGSGTAIATINAGDYYVVDENEYTANDNLHISTSNPVYVYQTSNGGNGVTDDNERQCGLNFIPPVGCSGSKNVFLPDVDFLGTAYINIIANTGTTIYVDGSPLGAGDAVTGTGDYVTYKLTNNYSGDIEITADDLIRVALINLSGDVGATGYFSGFTKDVVVQTQTVNADDIALEGCIQASFTFSLDAPADSDVEINYTVAGTATNGVDYSWVDSSLIIPQGQSSATVFIDAISDGVPESQESIYIIYQPDLCSPADTAELFINDAQPIEFTLDGTDLTCNDNSSGEIDATVTGGFPPYTYHVTDPQGSTSQYTSLPIAGLDAGQYSVQIYDSYGCKADALVVGGMFDADTTFLPDGSGVSYSTSINIQGFDSGETLDNMSQLQQICATMEHSYLGDLEIKIISPSGQEVILKEYPGGGSTNLGIPFAANAVDGQNSNLSDPGQGYEYCFNDAPVYATMTQEAGNYNGTFPSSTGGTYNDSYLPQGSYTSFENLSGLLGSDMNGNWTIEVTDNLSLDNGYIFNWNISLVSDLPDTLVTIEEPNDIEINGFISQANCGGNDGAINIEVTGDYPPYTFNWSNGAITEDLSNIGAGTYEVIVTDDNGCSDSATFNLNNISSINTASTITQVTCAGGSDGAIDLSTSGGTPPYTFSWSNGANTEDISGLSDGIYTVTITDDNGCQYTEDITVTTLPAINISVLSTTNEHCGTADGAITIDVSGGTGSYGFSWSNGATSQNIFDLTAGSYTVTVTDANGCSSQETFSIVNDVTGCSQFCYLDVEASTILDEQCGNASGSITLDITDATQPYNVTWDHGPTTETISNLSAGTYTVTILDANQCTVTETFTVGNNAGNLMVSNSIINDENCGNAQGNINITVTGGNPGYSFAWDNGATSEDLTNLSAGTYTVTITDNNGCSISESLTVNNNPGSISETAIVYNSTCGLSNGGINLSVTGGSGNFSYQWNSGQTTQDITNVNAGTYNCQITDLSSGCMINTTNYTIQNNTNTLEVINTSITNEECNNGQGAIDITVIGGTGTLSYNWDNGATTEDLSGLSAGTYICSITDQQGCNVITNALTVFNGTGDLTATTDQVVNEICDNDNGAIYINSSSSNMPISYSWNDGSTNEDNINLEAGNYTVTLTDAAGCTTTLTESINNTSGTLQIDNMIVTDENCGDGNGAIDAILSGGTAPYTYSWDNGAITEDLSGLSAGNYTITATDQNGCEVTATTTVNNNANNLQWSVQTEADTCGAGVGDINLSVTGGQAPYTYNWSNSATTSSLNNINAGTYTCTITDDNGCSISTNSITITDNPGNLSAVATWNDEMCGDGSGQIAVNATGGDGNYSYSWNTGATTPTLTGLNAGTYTYTVTDGNGCSYSESINILNQTNGLSLDNISASDELCNDDQGSIDISISGGNSPYTYNWSNGATSEDLSNLDEGIYSCTITDNNGCTISTNSIVIANNAGTLSLDNITVTDDNCNNSSGAIDIDVSGGTQPYTYSWNNGDNTEDINGLTAGNYDVVITDASGCSTTGQTSVQNLGGNLQVFNSIIDNETCSGNDGAIDLTISGGTSPYTFNWSNGATTEDLSGLSAGSYSVIITDAGGCQITEGFAIQNNGISLSITNASISDEVCNNNNGAIDVTVSGGTTPYSFNWSNGSVLEDIQNLSAGNYSFIVTDANGCSVSGNYTVNNNPGSLSIDNITVTDENCGDQNGAIDLSVSGTGTPFIFNWNNGATTEDLSGLSAGNFNVTVEDINGCTTTSNATVQNISGGFTASVGTISDENCGDGTGSIDINVNGGSTPYTYSWSNGATSEDLSGLNAGSYDVTITDNNNCSVQLNASVNNITTGLSIDNVVKQDVQCGSANGFIDLTVNATNTPVTYLWNTGALTEDIAGLTAGTYTCTITDNAGCTIVFDTTINNSSNVVLTSNVTHETCGNASGSIEVIASGGASPYSYNFTGGSPSNCCNYTLEMNDDFGDGWNGGNLEVFINGISIGTFAAVSNGSTETFSACNGDNIDLIYTAGDFENENDYTLYAPDGSVLFADGNPPATGSVFTTVANCPSTPNIISGLSAGSYSVTVTDAFGCTATENYTINNTNNPNLQFDFVQVQDEFCGFGNGVIQTQASGGNTITYYLDGTVFSGSDNNLTAGTYTVTAEDENGCTVDSTVTIGSDSFFDVTTNIVDETCGNGNGSIDLTLDPQAANYTYQWDDGATTQDRSNLSAGTYEVTITSTGNNCTQTNTYTVINDGDITITGTVADENCGDGSGAIDVTITGGTDITIIWDNGATSEDLSNLNAGDYTIEVMNNVTGCTSSELFTVNNNTGGLAINGTVIDEQCSNHQGAIDITVSGGSGNYAAVWDHGPTSQDLSGLSEGTYIITVEDIDNNCFVTATYTITNEIEFDVTGAVTGASCTTCTNGAIDITVNNISGPPFTTYNYEWSTGATTEDLTDLMPGTYEVIVTASNGCTDTVEFVVPNLDDLGINPFDDTSHLSVYPNPTKENFTLQFDFGRTQKFTIEIVNLVGSKVLDKTFTKDEGLIEFSTYGWEDGVYLIHIYSNDTDKTLKLVKTK